MPDLEHALRSVMAVRATIPKDAFTADALGTERSGSGVIIRESGLVLTIGYLITEAEDVWLTGANGRVTQGHALAYDQETGFGLVQALGRLDLPAIDLGQSSQADVGDAVVLAGGERGQYVRANIIAKDSFAGYWEYLLDEAIFTAPAHPLWGGAALIDAAGRLIGIGSLRMQQMNETGRAEDVNMVVPIDLLPPILNDLLSYGTVNKKPRPWLGIFCAENDGQVVIANVAEKSPAAEAGLAQGDIIMGVGETGIGSLADFYRKVWRTGPAGSEIAVQVLREGRGLRLRVASTDRGALLKKPRLQ